MALDLYEDRKNIGVSFKKKFKTFWFHIKRGQKGLEVFIVGLSTLGYGKIVQLKFLGMMKVWERTT